MNPLWPLTLAVLFLISWSLLIFLPKGLWPFPPSLLNNIFVSKAFLDQCFLFAHNWISISHLCPCHPMNVSLLLNLAVNYNYLCLCCTHLPIPDHELVPPGKGHYLTLLFEGPAQRPEQNRCSTVLELGIIPFYLLGIWCPYLSNDLFINYRAEFVQDPQASSSFYIQDDDDDNGEWTLSVP